MTPSLAFSVVIPTHNRHARVCRAVESVLAGRLPADEILVVDDGSSDETVTALARFGPRVRLLRLEQNRGVATARNLGSRTATHPWIALLDSDDYWLEDHLAGLANHLLRHPECRVVQSRERWYRHGVRVQPRVNQIPRSGDIYLPSLERCLVSSSAVVVHRDLLSGLGYYDERFPVCEDYDLWLRMARTTRFGLVDQETVVKDGPREDQLSRRFWGMDRFRVFALVKLLSEFLPSHLAVETRRIALNKLEILRQGAAKRGQVAPERAYQRWIGAIQGEEENPPALPAGGRYQLPGLLQRAGFCWSERVQDPILSALNDPEGYGNHP